MFLSDTLLNEYTAQSDCMVSAHNNSTVPLHDGYNHSDSNTPGHANCYTNCTHSDGSHSDSHYNSYR